MREPRLYAYLDERSGPVPDYLYTVERNTHLYALKPQMLTGHMQGRFLVWLTEWLASAKTDQTQPFDVLEVGGFTGYSALCFAEALLRTSTKRAMPRGHVTSIEMNEERETLFRRHVELAGFGESLTLYIGDANVLLGELNATYDLVYLDGRKADYPSQLEQCRKLLRPGGHILLDNVLWDGQVLEPDNQKATAVMLREFTLKLARDTTWETLMLPMRDGLMLLRQTG